MMKYVPCFCLQIKRLENRLSKTECTDNNGQERKDGERWKKDSCTLCECKVGFLAKSLCTLCWTHCIQYPDEPIVLTWRFNTDASLTKPEVIWLLISLPYIFVVVVVPHHIRILFGLLYICEGTVQIACSVIILM